MLFLGLTAPGFFGMVVDTLPMYLFYSRGLNAGYRLLKIIAPVIMLQISGQLNLFDAVIPIG